MLGLKKTGWRIKELISDRKTPNLGTSDRNSLEDVGFVDTKVSTNSTKRLSWLTQSPTVEITPFRRAMSQATVQTYHMPTVNATAHSSVTSLCSCDCAANPASIEPPLSKECSASDQPEILYLPPLSPSHASGDAQTWRLIFSDSPSRSSASSISKSGQKGRSTPMIAAGSTFDLIEALALESKDDDKMPTQNIKHTYNSEMGDLSDNVEQLIRETDAAFQAVGTALADAKAATQGWYETDTFLPRNSPLSRSILKKSPRSSGSTVKIQASRSMSVVKKKKHGKRNLLGRALQSTAPTPASTPSRWTLTDVTTNMVDVFSGKIFRTEVDEMLTPGRLQQLQNSIRLENDPRKSADSARSAETDESTPTEPFHLQSLSNRISAAQKNPPPFPSTHLPIVTPQPKGQAPERPSRPNPSRKVQFADQAGMTIDELTFPSPPRLPRRPSASGNVPLLPTIPEISPLTLSTVNLFTSTSNPLSSPLIHSEPQDNYIYLPSTPFTLTSPLFRHGAIRVPLPYREPKLSPSDEEALDWTAFQMAISGTGGINGYALGDSYEREERETMEIEEDEREREGILEWWAGFGFQGVGRMVGDPRLREISKLIPRRGGSLKRRRRREEIERVIVKEAKESARRGKISNKETSDIDKIIAENQKENGAGIGAQRRGSLTDSLPPSPMLDLVVPSQSKNNEVIPMGFNLGHDLGDFLNWETHHVQTLFLDD